MAQQLLQAQELAERPVLRGPGDEHLAGGGARLEGPGRIQLAAGTHDRHLHVGWKLEGLAQGHGLGRLGLGRRPLERGGGLLAAEAGEVAPVLHVGAVAVEHQAGEARPEGLLLAEELTRRVPLHHRLVGKAPEQDGVGGQLGMLRGGWHGPSLTGVRRDQSTYTAKLDR
ncbi:hypothetical protein D3C86_1706320 [compost metagenome]